MCVYRGYNVIKIKLTTHNPTLTTLLLLPPQPPSTTPTTTRRAPFHTLPVPESIKSLSWQRASAGGGEGPNALSRLLVATPSGVADYQVCLHVCMYVYMYVYVCVYDSLNALISLYHPYYSHVFP